MKVTSSQPSLEASMFLLRSGLRVGLSRLLLPLLLHHLSRFLLLLLLLRPEADEVIPRSISYLHALIENRLLDSPIWPEKPRMWNHATYVQLSDHLVRKKTLKFCGVFSTNSKTFLDPIIAPWCRRGRGFLCLWCCPPRT